jgi:hypothetical protein
MSKPEVFIIESLKFEEEESYREGEMIAKALTMSLKNPIYRYVRTITELQHFVDEFEDSDYRYLHISCHGSKSGVFTTLEDLSIDEFADIVGPVLDGKRLFLSTCQASTARMAKAVFKRGGCTSLAGPVNRINFDDSVVLWTSFYHLMFKANTKQMKREQIKKTISEVAGLLGETVNFFTSRNRRLFTDTVLPQAANPRRSH